MSWIRFANVCGGAPFASGLLVNIGSELRFNAASINATIMSQLAKEDAKRYVDAMEFEKGATNYGFWQAGIGAALACLREKRHE